jgi:hypothetical protein
VSPVLFRCRLRLIIIGDGITPIPIGAITTDIVIKAITTYITTTGATIGIGLGLSASTDAPGTIAIGKRRVLRRSAQETNRRRFWNWNLRSVRVRYLIAPADLAHVPEVLAACGFRSRVFHATKTEMIGAGIDFALAARADHITRTVLIVTKK